jgi:hypothetical protein
VSHDDTFRIDLLMRYLGRLPLFELMCAALRAQR